MEKGLQKFNEDVDILQKAYFDGILEHDNCSACVAGNLMSAKGQFITVSSGADNYLITDDDKNADKWHSLICGYAENGDKIGAAQIKSIGYSIKEVRRFEAAFEATDDGYDKDGYNGLMAAVDVLADINGVDLSVVPEAKKGFVKNPTGTWIEESSEITQEQFAVIEDRIKTT